jgi:hypothetical protein
MHVVSVEPEIDSIQGRCTGKAVVSLRHYPSEKKQDQFRRNMERAGLSVSQEEKCRSKRENYVALMQSVNDPRHIEDTRSKALTHRSHYSLQPSNSASNPRLAKVKELASSCDLFGNSSPDLIAPNKLDMEHRKINQTLQNWN